MCYDRVDRLVEEIGGERMESTTIIVIPAEGDSPDTETAYVKRLKRYYTKVHHRQLNVLVFEHDCVSKDRMDIFISTILRVRWFVQEHDLENAEIHAQGGLGAFVAYEFLRYCPEKIATVFMVGGAPSDAMTWVAKLFHRGLIRLWYHFRWLIPFFADDPNPKNDETIERIKASSTEFMRAYPEVYRNQLLYIGEWCISDDWQALSTYKVYFVPNGKTVRPTWWDNTYNNERAKEVWARHGVQCTEAPGDNFSFYSLMPAQALFKIMDSVR